MPFKLINNGIPNRLQEDFQSANYLTEGNCGIPQNLKEIPPFGLHILVICQSQDAIKAILFEGGATVLQRFLDGSL